MAIGMGMGMIYESLGICVPRSVAEIFIGFLRSKWMERFFGGMLKLRWLEALGEQNKYKRDV